MLVIKRQIIVSSKLYCWHSFVTAKVKFPLSFFMWCFGPIASQGLHLLGFAITFRHTTVGGTPLDE